MNRVVVLAALIGVTAALPLDAQGRGQSQSQNRSQTQSRIQTQGRGPVAVPPGHWPSAGRCRVWIDGVPPGRQPRETDCLTARRTVPPNGRVLEGSSRRPVNGDDRDGRTDRYDRDDDDDRNTRRFIDRNGLECEEKAVTKNGRRSYDLKCREPKRRNGDRGGWPPVSARDDDRYGRDDDRTTRRFIDRNGLECEEKAVTKNGKRSYDLKCREPKHRNEARGGWPPVSVRDDDRHCVDTNRDGRCDSGTGRGYPTTLPEMIGAIVYGQGQRTDDVSRWLGAGRYQVRYTDQNRDRRPERVRWMDAAGVLLQEWTDTNRDGRADVVNVYSAGRLIQSIGGR